jgi:Tol biopolymer transport system component
VGTIAYVPGATANPRLSMLAVAPIDGSGKVQPLPVVAALYTAPRISPDGRQMAVTVADDRGSSIWVGNLAPPSPLRRLTAGTRDRGALWSADSRFVQFTGENPDVGVYRQVADGSAPAERVIAAPTILAAEGTHPDGKTIVFSQGPDADLWSVSAGSAPQPLVIRPGLQRFATFSPDGRFFAYISRVQGKNDIFVEPFPPNGSLHQLSTGGTGPRWSPTGTDIFYQLNASDANVFTGKLMKIPVRTTPTFSAIGIPVEVPISPLVTATFSNFDITLDGKRVLVVMPARGAVPQDRPPAQQIHVVVNWQEELKAKVPTQ